MAASDVREDSVVMVPSLRRSRPQLAQDAPVTLDDLVIHVARGDTAAFEALYDQLADVVFGVIRRVLRDPAQSEEVAQEVLVEVWRTSTRFDPNKGGASTWILTMAHRRAIDRVRSAQAAHDREERVAQRDHVPAFDEVAELAATAARLGAAVAAPAPETMRARVLAEVARTRQVSPVVTGLHHRRKAQPWFRQPVGVAASILLVVALGLGVFAAAQRRRADQADERADLIAAIITDPHRAQATADIASGGSGILVVAGHRAIFDARGVKSLPGDRTYQLWIIGSKGVRSVGVLGSAGSGDIRQFVDGVTKTDEIGLTVEPEGGSDKPTTKPIMVLPVPA